MFLGLMAELVVWRHCISRFLSSEDINNNFFDKSVEMGIIVIINYVTYPNDNTTVRIFPASLSPHCIQRHCLSERGISPLRYYAALSDAPVH